MLHRRFMMQQASGDTIGSAFFKFVVNYSSSDNKNALTATTSDGTSASISTRGIAFVVYFYNPDAEQVALETMNTSFASATDTLSIELKITTPSNETYTFTKDNVLVAQDEKKYLALFVNLDKKIDDSCTFSDGSNSVMGSVAYFEYTYVGNWNYGVSSSGLQTFGAGTTLSSKYLKFANAYLGGAFEEGNYTIEATLNGKVPPKIYVSNGGWSTQATVNKSTYNAYSVNRSRVQWLDSSENVVNNMFDQSGDL